MKTIQFTITLQVKGDNPLEAYEKLSEMLDVADCVASYEPEVYVDDNSGEKDIAILEAELNRQDDACINDGKDITYAGLGFGFSFRSGTLTNKECRNLRQVFADLYAEPLKERFGERVLANRQVGMTTCFGIGDRDTDDTDGVIWGWSDKTILKLIYQSLCQLNRNRVFPYTIEHLAYYVKAGSIYMPRETANQNQPMNTKATTTQNSKCECGAVKCRTTHATWCPEYNQYKE